MVVKKKKTDRETDKKTDRQKVKVRRSFLRVMSTEENVLYLNVERDPLAPNSFLRSQTN